MPETPAPAETFVFAPDPEDEPSFPLYDTEEEPDEDEAAESFDDAAQAGAAPADARPPIGPTDLDLPGRALPHFGADLDDAAREPAAPTEPDGDDEPLWQRLARERGAETVVDETAAEGPPLWQRFADPATDDAPHPAERPEVPAPAASRPTSLSDLEARVLGDDGERRGWFVDELFAGSSDEYHRTLAALDAACSWTEATEIIARDVFRRHRVNIYSEPAVAFTDAVEAQMTRP